MPKKNPPEPEVSAQGIKVYLAEDQWVLYDPEDWGIDDQLTYQSSRNDFVAFRIIVEKLKDWRIRDRNGALIPFDRAELLDTLTGLENGRRVIMTRDEFSRRMAEIDASDPTPEVRAVRVAALGIAPLPHIPIQMQSKFNSSFFIALAEARNLPLVQESPAGGRGAANG